ncbi:MAG: magnesium transporter CorA family protein [Lysobacterales bacterium]
MINVQRINTASGNSTSVQSDDIQHTLDDLTEDEILWVAISDPKPADDDALRSLGAHELALQDALRVRHPAKYEAFAKHQFLLLKDLLGASDALDSDTCQCAVFIFNRLLVSRCNGPSPALEAIWQLAQEDPQRLSGGGTTLALRLMRTLADRYLHVLVKFEGRIESIEDAMAVAPTDSLLTDLTRYRANLKRLRRIFAYHQQAAADMRSELGAGPHEHRLTDVYEQFSRLSSLAQLHHDIMTELADGFLALSTHRLNGIMKVLTIVTVVFVPLSFLAGIYGMNFEYIPELTWRYGYFLLLGTMATIALGLLAFFRWRHWL